MMLTLHKQWSAIDIGSPTKQDIRQAIIEACVKDHADTSFSLTDTELNSLTLLIRDGLEITAVFNDDYYIDYRFKTYSWQEVEAYFDYFLYHGPEQMKSVMLERMQVPKKNPTNKKTGRDITLSSVIH
ncbi:MAG: hypothetical protein JST96_04655 [Bacteroidetes bacterium]|nr:hypothetical protein [Bacteroidota bacterium]